MRTASTGYTLSHSHPHSLTLCLRRQVLPGDGGLVVVRGSHSEDSNETSVTTLPSDADRCCHQDAANPKEFLIDLIAEGSKDSRAVEQAEAELAHTMLESLVRAIVPLDIALARARDRG